MIRIAIDQNTNFWPALYLPTSGSRSSSFAEHALDRASQALSSRFHSCARQNRTNRPAKLTEQHDADPRMDRARPLPAAEQVSQQEQRRVEHRQAGQRQQHEARRR